MTKAAIGADFPEQFDLLRSQVADKERRETELMGEIAGLRGVVIACSEKPMPEWSKKVWESDCRAKDAEAQISTLKAQLEREREAADALVKTLNHIRDIGDGDVVVYARISVEGYTASKESK